MNILAISDCHGLLPQIPTDVLKRSHLILNAGDICPDYRGDTILAQWQWMNRHYREYLEYLPPMIAVWGNHDFIGERSVMANTLNLRWTLLQDREVAVGGLRIYGSPWSPRFYDWAFMRNEAELDRIYAGIPEGLDILISHTPPYQCCDANAQGEYCGSEALRHHIDRAQPRLVLCGHIHEAAKQESYIGNSRVVNVCSLTRDPYGRELDDVPYMEFNMEPV